MEQTAVAGWLAEDVERHVYDLLMIAGIPVHWRYVRALMYHSAVLQDELLQQEGGDAAFIAASRRKELFGMAALPLSPSDENTDGGTKPHDSAIQAESTVRRLQRRLFQRVHQRISAANLRLHQLLEHPDCSDLLNKLRGGAVDGPTQLTTLALLALRPSATTIGTSATASSSSEILSTMVVEVPPPGDEVGDWAAVEVLAMRSPSHPSNAWASIHDPPSEQSVLPWPTRAYGTAYTRAAAMEQQLHDGSTEEVASMILPAFTIALQRHASKTVMVVDDDDEGETMLAHAQHTSVKGEGGTNRPPRQVQSAVSPPTVVVISDESDVEC